MMGGNGGIVGTGAALLTEAGRIDGAGPAWPAAAGSFRDSVAAREIKVGFGAGSMGSGTGRSTFRRPRFASFDLLLGDFAATGVGSTVGADFELLGADKIERLPVVALGGCTATGSAGRVGAPGSLVFLLNGSFAREFVGTARGLGTGLGLAAALALIAGAGVVSSFLAATGVGVREVAFF